VVWLPAGEWFDFFGGGRFAGDGWHAVYGGLDEIPVFAKAGGIVPLAVGDGLVNPEALAVHLFPGADNAFDLYEDDGAAAHSLTPIRQSWGDGAWSVTIGPAEGETGHLPEARTWEVCFRGAAETAVSANTDFAAEYDSETRTLRVTAVLPPTAALTITLSDGNGALLAADDRILPACQKLVAAFRMESWAKQRLFKRLPDITANPAGLARFALDLTPGQLRALLEVITGAGFRRSGSRRSPEEQIVLWNNGGGEAVTYQLAAREVNGRIIRAVNKREPLPKFGLFTIGAEALRYHEGNRPAAGRMSVAAWFESLAAQVGGSALPDGAAVQFDLSGENGRVAYLVGEDGRVSLVDGVHPDPAVTLAAAAADWLRLLNGELTPEGMFLEGKLRMTGDLELALQLAGSISLSPPGVYRPDEWRLYVDYLDVVRLVGSGE
jgi:putative sterol carrier protein